MENRLKHDPVAIGYRIKQRRKDIGLSQEAFLEALRCAGGGMSKPTLVKLERGELGDLTIRQCIALCEVLSCDIGYLLCEYDSRTLTTEGIVEHTGLTEQAIDTLHYLHTIQQDTEADERKKATTKHVLPFINQLLENRAAVTSVGANLNEIAFASEYETAFSSTGHPDRNVLRIRNGGMYALSRTIEQQADTLLGNPYAGNRE